MLPGLRPDLVVYEQYELGAAVAAHAAGIPAVCHSLSPRPPDELIRMYAGERLDRLWAEHDMSAFSLDVLTGDAFVDIFPNVLQQPSFLDHPARLRLRPIPFTEPGVTVPTWVGRSGRPLVYLTLGTVVASDEVLVPAIHGLATLDADVLVALGSADGATLGELPPNVRVKAFVDQAAVLCRADLAVHHGGSGTVLGALASGTPQLLLPKGADQFQNADAMAAAGLAAVLEPSETTVSAVAAEATASIGRLSPAAAAVRDELLAMPGPSEVLEQLIARFEDDEKTAAA